MQCTYLLLATVIASGSNLAQQYTKLATAFEDCANHSGHSPAAPHGGSGSGSDEHSVYRNASSAVQYLHMLQLPVFDMVRCIFAG